MNKGGMKGKIIQRKKEKKTGKGVEVETGQTYKSIPKANNNKNKNNMGTQSKILSKPSNKVYGHLQPHFTIFY